jgi:hypothetical protein
MKPILFLITLILFSITLWAQWVDDPNMNTPIFVSTGDTTLPKIEVTSSGNTFISCNSAETGNYDLRLQYLDGTGTPLWQAGGILVSNHQTMTWITDYDMALAADSIAVIAYSDVRLNGSDLHPNIYAVSASGQFLWGNDGIQLSSQGTFEPDPKVTVTEQGNTVVCWQRDTSPYNSVVMQMISPTGQLLWGNGIEYLSVDNSDFWYPMVVPVHTEQENSNEVILVWEKRYGMYTINLAAQKFDGNGIPMWTTDVAISDNGGFPFYSRFTAISDKHGGAFVGWHVYRGNYFDAYYQHVNSNGTNAFPVNGVIFSTDQSRMYLEPVLVYDTINNYMYAYCLMKNGNQDEWGILGQKFDAFGSPMWTTSGIDIISLGSVQIANIKAALAGDTSVVFYLEDFSNSSNSRLKARRISPSGDPMWHAGSVVMCSVSSGKQKMVISPFMNNQAVVTWVDDRNDWGDVYAQNIWTTGELGGQTDNNEYVVLPSVSGLSNYPNPFNSETTIAFSVKNPGHVNLEIYNLKGQLVKALVSECKAAGESSVTWNGKDNSNHSVTSGVYIYKMTSGNDRIIKKMILVK